MSNVGDDARQVLQAAIDRKVAAVEAYAAAQTRRAEIVQELQTAESAESEKWHDLKRLDWTDSELKALGLNPPSGATTKRPASRSRKRQASADNSGQQS